jgi:TrpR-related protein YerC/YecD
MKEINEECMDMLFKAILQLETLDECRRFFSDLCTISELKSMSQRMEVALMLKRKCVYTDIGSKTGASTATISRVNKCINYGSDGYNLVIKRMEKDNE